MQTSYAQPSTAVAGQLEPGLSEVLSLQNLSTQAVEVQVGTVTDSANYEITLAYTSQAGATYGNAVTETPDYTADGTATKAEILAGLKAAVDALTSGKFTTQLVDATNGPLLIKAVQPGFVFTCSVDSKMSVAEQLGEVPFGALVVQETFGKCRLPQVAADFDLDLAIASSVHSVESSSSGDPRFAYNSQLPGVKWGRVWVPVEGAVAAGAQAYARFAASGSNTQKGKFRADRDGTAQVTTITPTAVNSTIYNLAINGRAYAITSDGSATATEIAAAFIALINADADVGVTASGTATLVLTANVPGVPFVVSLGANLAAAATTANALKAGKVEGCKYLTSTSGAGLALMQVKL